MTNKPEPSPPLNQRKLVSSKCSNVSIHIKMATQVRETVPWLNSKLSEAWSSLSVTSTLTKEVMQSIKQHFILFSVEIKLRLLISCIGLRKLSLKELEQDVKELCQLAMEDDDDWVQAMGAFISTFADRGVMAFDELLKNQYFASTIFSLKTKMQTEQSASFCPLDYAFLDPSLIDSKAVEAAQSNAHFKVKKSTPRMPPRQVKPLGGPTTTATAPSTTPTALSSRPILPKPPIALARPPSVGMQRPVPPPTTSLPATSSPLSLSSSGGFPRPRATQKPKKMMVLMGENEEDEILKEQEEEKKRAEEKKEQERLEKLRLAEEKHRKQVEAAEEIKAAKKRKREEKEAQQMAASAAKRQKKLAESEAKNEAQDAIGETKEADKNGDQDQEVDTNNATKADSATVEIASNPSVDSIRPMVAPPLLNSSLISLTAGAGLSNIMSTTATATIQKPMLPPATPYPAGPLSFGQTPTLFPQSLVGSQWSKPQQFGSSPILPSSAPSAVTATPMLLSSNASTSPEDHDKILETIFSRANKADPHTRKIVEQIVREQIDATPFVSLGIQQFTLHEEITFVDGVRLDEATVFEWRPQEKTWRLQQRVRKHTQAFGMFSTPNPSFISPATSSAAQDLQNILATAAAPSISASQDLQQVLQNALNPKG